MAEKASLYIASHWIHQKLLVQLKWQYLYILTYFFFQCWIPFLNSDKSLGGREKGGLSYVPCSGCTVLVQMLNN